MQKQLQFGVAVFPGTNCDRDTFWVLDKVLEQKVKFIWHTDSDIEDMDVIIIPGGFSYGDYLRSGAIARISPIMKAVIEHTEKGKKVLGICNGFQILAEAQLIKGAFLRNKGIHFLCQDQFIKVTSNNSPFTHLYQKEQVLKIPIAHGDGNYYLSPEDLDYTLENDLIAFKYCDRIGNLNDANNPNGSIEHIAGVFNKAKNVLGMMPHPERSSEFELGSTDGKLLFESIIQWAMD